jgi:zinc protease
MNIILGQGESSRLNVAIVRRAKAALGAGAGSAGTHRGPGTMFVFGISNQGVAAAHLDSLLAAQVDTLRQSGVTADELTKAKNTFRAQFIENRETVLNKAEELHHYAMFHANLADINADLDHFMAVTNDDIRRVATKYLDPANAVILIVKPAAGGGQ